MKVSELIAKLVELNPERIVKTYNEEYSITEEVTSVFEDGDKDVIIT